MSTNYQRIVVKLGTSVLTGGSDRLNSARMVELVRQMAVLRQAGTEVILCTSGAMAAGREHLGFPALSDSMADKQLLAAVGQTQLIQRWENLFQIYGLHVGQLLLTGADLRDRERYLNAQDTLNALLSHGIIPVVNENDAVATTEIKVGDNDNLSARAALLGQADLLVLLTDQDGLFDADPRSNPQAQLIERVDAITPQVLALAGGSGTHLGTGGMATKLQAAQLAQRAGIEVIIAAGGRDNVLLDAFAKRSVGTRVSAHANRLESRKQWLLAGPKARGKLILDSGAVNAISSQGRSLLAKGIIDCQGEFERGALVALHSETGELLAQGLSRYNANDITRIRGQHSQAIGERLGYDYGKVVVHRNDLVLQPVSLAGEQK
ncbi:glutamate 5-kinase [Paraferrimonas sedimenticola]|uniref:Glutamate 5-kinase n=1 Tax=Paraferrimonas sedimenticola TaxID=375674 RepID=A0AA37RXX0_9GAMM|nr:glutamate 5-kinase [Paraferrimonas sedimenticola]GLP96914.1 glutamate 5-kinase [Paraferrimonas sedimenticola]